MLGHQYLCKKRKTENIFIIYMTFLLDACDLRAVDADMQHVVLLIYL